MLCAKCIEQLAATFGAGQANIITTIPQHPTLAVTSVTMEAPAPIRAPASLILEAYSVSVGHQPPAGRHIMAHTNPARDTVVVYQAYRKSIADPACAHQVGAGRQAAMSTTACGLWQGTSHMAVQLRLHSGRAGPGPSSAYTCTPLPARHLMRSPHRPKLQLPQRASSSPHVRTCTLQDLVTDNSDFRPDRMTWIKPGFLWMMYRCGWVSSPAAKAAQLTCSYL